MIKTVKTKPAPEFHITCLRTSLGWSAKIETRKKARTVQIYANGMSERDQKGEVCAAIGQSILMLWK